MRRSRRAQLRAEALEARDTPAAIGIAPGFPPPLAVSGPADGVVKLYPAVFSTGQYNTTPESVSPFGAIAAEVRTAFGDVNGDGIDDLVAITGPGVPVRFVAISGADFATVLVAQTDPFGGNFTGGGFAAAGDIDRDGKADMVFTPDQGGGPRVVIFDDLNEAARLRASFFGIADAAFRGGARVAVGDINFDRSADVVIAAGPGGGPRVAIYDGRALLQAGTTPQNLLGSDFFVFPNADLLRDGVYVAVGDIDSDGFGDLIVGAGDGGGPRVLVLGGRLIATKNLAAAQTTPVENFFFGDPNGRAGVRVAAKSNGIGTRAEVVAATGRNLPSRVRVYTNGTPVANVEPTPFQEIDPYGRVMADGVYVG